MYLSRQVFLSAHEYDYRIFGDLPDFCSPPLQVGHAIWIISIKAEHECVSLMINDLAVDLELLIATCVMDLQVDLTSLNHADALVNIKHTWRSIFVELVSQISRQ